MDKDEFLALPKQKEQPRDRIIREIERLKQKLMGFKGKNFCGKHTYSKKAAKKAIRRSRGTDIELLNYYYCEKCDGWHVSSKDQKEYWRNK